LNKFKFLKSYFNLPFWTNFFTNFGNCIPRKSDFSFQKFSKFCNEFQPLPIWLMSNTVQIYCLTLLARFIPPISFILNETIGSEIFKQYFLQYFINFLSFNSVVSLFVSKAVVILWPSVLNSTWVKRFQKNGSILSSYELPWYVSSKLSQN